MPIQSGSRLGPYELVAPIGAGGMGEVWRARDTRLERSVAVKILPAAFAEDEERRQRFEREAKTISSLNHPHICTLFDVGHEGDTHFLVMELVEGESLADRLQKGPLPLDQVVKFGAQVADALSAAHKQGIVHRDLKPGNVMLTKAGAKLLDFGLARTGAGLGGASGSTELPTEVKPLTTAGTVLGTFQYMAPEQLEGQDADARTDVFALGALLYEMATGRRAFEGKSKTSLIAAILASQPPPISSVQPVMPPALDHVVKRCLEKDPDDRWQSAHDVASELRWTGEAGSQAGVPTTLSVRRRSRERLAWALAGAFAVAAASGVAWALKLRQDAREADRPFRSDLVAPPGHWLGPAGVGAMALSPDGRSLAYVTFRDRETSGLAVRGLASGETKVVEGTDGATYPFWSPDSRWLGFFADGRLKKVEAAGGPVQVLCVAHAGRGGTWSAEGTLVFAPDIMGSLARVSAAGGVPVAATRTSDPSVSHRNPWFLPDGRHFLFTERNRNASFGRVAVASLDGGDAKTLLEKGWSPQYAGGFLFAVVGGNLTAQPFDAGRRVLTRQPLPVAGSVESLSARDLANFSVSRAGVLAYRQRRMRRTQLVWMDRAGRELSTAGDPSHYLELGPLGRGGRSIATVRCDSMGNDADVWMLDLPRSQATRSTSLSAAGYLFAAVSPDGAQLAVSSASGAGAMGTLWVQPATGSGSARTLQENGVFTPSEWSADGSLLVGATQQVETGFDIAYVRPGRPSETVHFTTSRFDETFPALSEDGRFIAYESTETGRSEVFLSDFPRGAHRWQVSRAGGNRPTWRSDGGELYFAGPDKAMAVAVSERNGGIEIGAPAPLPFERERFRLDLGLRSPDGKRFLVERFAEEAAREPVRLVQSWSRLLDE